MFQIRIVGAELSTALSFYPEKIKAYAVRPTRSMVSRVTSRTIVPIASTTNSSQPEFAADGRTAGLSGLGGRSDLVGALVPDFPTLLEVPVVTTAFSFRRLPWLSLEDFGDRREAPGIASPKARPEERMRPTPILALPSITVAVSCAAQRAQMSTAHRHADRRPVVTFITPDLRSSAREDGCRAAKRSRTA